MWYYITIERKRKGVFKMIDIKLNKLDEKREVKWENCMRVINQSLENKLIYNVDFKNLNQDLSRVIEY